MTNWKQVKDPSDADFYEVKIGEAWLGSDVITSATFEAENGSGFTITEPGIENNLVRVFISGGNAGDWGIEVTINTQSGRKIQRTINLKVAEL